MSRFVTSLIVFVAVINLLPVVGVLSGERLTSLYGVVFEDPNVLILMRHRALLLAMVGALLMLSAFRPKLRQVATPCGFFSMLSYLAICLSAGGFNPHLERVVAADLVACVALFLATVLDRPRLASQFSQKASTRDTKG